MPSKLLRITEINMWERERWTYVLDTNNIDAHTLNILMIFVRLANEQFAKDQKEAMQNGMECFASSKYILEFYDSLEDTPSGPMLVNKCIRLNIKSNTSYKTGGIFLTTEISPRKMNSAMVRMRKHQENALYKNFESVFLK